MATKVTVKPNGQQPVTLAEAGAVSALTPSQEVVQDPNAEFTITDARGRVLTMRKPGVLAQFRFVEALGDVAKNQVYTGMALPLIYLTKIDGDRVPAPSNKKEIEALIVRLDEEGVAAIAEEIGKRFGKQDPEADKDSLKN